MRQFVAKGRVAVKLRDRLKILRSILSEPMVVLDLSLKGHEDFEIYPV